MGVGIGIVLDGTLFTSAAGTTGEIDHTILHLDRLPCSCGRHGCAEAYFGPKAVARADRLLRNGSEIDRAGLVAGLAQRTREAFGDALGMLTRPAARA